MTTLVHFTIPADTFALSETFQTNPDMTVRCEASITESSTPGMPLVWIHSLPRQVLADALANDPTVAAATRLAGVEETWLYHIEWAKKIQIVLEMLSAANAMLLDATGTADGWQFHALYPERSALRTAHEIWQDHELTVELTTIRDLDTEDTPPTAFLFQGRLTDEQYTALQHAHEHGYFAIPRGASLNELAADLGISHQALSERLRRAHQTLIETTLYQHGSAQVPAPAETANDSAELGGQQLLTD